MTLLEIERNAIREALDRNKGNRTHTARELGISIRTLRNWLSGRFNKKLYLVSDAGTPITPDWPVTQGAEALPANAHQGT
jgi:transposase-like protein